VVGDVYPQRVDVLNGVNNLKDAIYAFASNRGQDFNTDGKLFLMLIHELRNG
jgi:hypothetical protein